MFLGFLTGNFSVTRALMNLGIFCGSVFRSPLLDLQTQDNCQLYQRGANIRAPQKTKTSPKVEYKEATCQMQQKRAAGHWESFHWRAVSIARPTKEIY
jgi:hypothetical protein